MIWKRREKKIDIPIIEYLDKLLKEEKALGYILKVSVGTDSQRSGRGYKFATVILITRQEDMGGGTIIGRGGMVIHADYHLTVYKKNKDGVSERMMAEVTKSMEVAYEITPILIEHGINLEIHADINPDPKWESNKALSQAIGWVLAMGYEFKIKPDAWAASFCGDKYAQ